MSCSLSPPVRAPGRQTTALSLRGSAQYLPTAPLEGGGPLREASLLGPAAFTNIHTCRSLQKWPALKC